jgi:hypothetical protein
VYSTQGSKLTPNFEKLSEIKYATFKKITFLQTMVSFQRMKDEIDGWGNTVTSRVPAITKSGCLTIVAITVFLLVIIGFAIGYGSRYVTAIENVLKVR